MDAPLNNYTQTNTSGRGRCHDRTPWTVSNSILCNQGSDRPKWFMILRIRTNSNRAYTLSSGFSKCQPIDIDEESQNPSISRGSVNTVNTNLWFLLHDKAQVRCQRYTKKNKKKIMLHCIVIGACAVQFLYYVPLYRNTQHYATLNCRIKTRLCAGGTSKL